jgi:hypothetical protein
VVAPLVVQPHQPSIVVLKPTVCLAEQGFAWTNKHTVQATVGLAKQGFARTNKQTVQATKEQPVQASKPNRQTLGLAKQGFTWTSRQYMYKQLN